jgi:hypothetical protein
LEHAFEAGQTLGASRKQVIVILPKNDRLISLLSRAGRDALQQLKTISGIGKGEGGNVESPRLWPGKELRRSPAFAGNKGFIFQPAQPWLQQRALKDLLPDDISANYELGGIKLCP